MLVWVLPNLCNIGFSKSYVRAEQPTDTSSRRCLMQTARFPQLLTTKNQRKHTRMSPFSWQRCFPLLLLLLSLALTIQLTVGGRSIQRNLEAHRVRRTLAEAPPLASQRGAPGAAAAGSTVTASASAATKSVINSNANRHLRTPESNASAASAEENKTLEPTSLLERIRQASHPKEYQKMVRKFATLGSAVPDDKLARSIDKCTDKNRNGRPIPAIKYIQDYEYLHKANHLCIGELLALIAVHSNAKNLARRASIRRTWGSLRYFGRHRIDVAFFLGRPASGDSDASGATGDKLQALIDEESNRYGDIVQLDYTENYRNLTIKHLAVYEWILTHCSSAEFLVKVDDDTFTDVAHLATFLSRGTPPGLYCSATGGARPQRLRRGAKSKWTVTRQEFSGKIYPPYCEGFGYILRASHIADIYLCSLFKKFFWIDDVQVTGILANSVGVPLSRFWRGHSFAIMVPSLASEVIMDYIFLTAERSEFFDSVWHKLWFAVLQHSLDVNL